MKIRLFGLGSPPAKDGGFALIAPLVDAALGAHVSPKRAAICTLVTMILSSLATSSLLRLRQKGQAEAARVGTQSGMIEFQRALNTSPVSSTESAKIDELISLLKSAASNSTQTEHGTRT